MRHIRLAAATTALLLATLGHGRPAHAGMLVNGDFSNGPTGWTATETTVSVVSGQAVIQESSNVSEVDLYQDFTLPAGAVSLSFTLVGVNEESDGPVPDAFGVSLLDPANGFVSLVPTVDAFTDSFYIRDLVPGTTQGNPAAGVTVSPAADALPLRITLDVTGLGGRDVEILFRVLGFGSSSDAAVTIDDVTLTTGAAVPEPGGLALACCAGVVLLGRRLVSQLLRLGPSASGRRKPSSSILASRSMIPGSSSSANCLPIAPSRWAALFIP